MELDLKEFLTICVVLIVISGISYSLFIFDNQKQMIKVQGYVISNQNFEIKEKENLLEKERILDEDNDEDGLSLRQEKELGTFDTMVDSDSDGVIDKYDEHPAGGGRMIVKHLEWNYKGKYYSLDLGIPSDVVTYYEQIPRPKWKGDYSYYSEFVDYKGLDALVNSFEIFIESDWDYYEEVMFVVSMVQQMHYSSDVLVGFDQFSKFPLQTLNDGTGDCEDMAVLSAAILKKMGYDVKLVFINILDGENHVAIAVFGDDIEGVYFEDQGKKYFYIETIMSGYGFGEFPSRWIEGNIILIDVE